MLRSGCDQNSIYRALTYVHSTELARGKGRFFARGRARSPLPVVDEIGAHLMKYAVVRSFGADGGLYYWHSYEGVVGQWQCAMPMTTFDNVFDAEVTAAESNLRFGDALAVVVPIPEYDELGIRE